MPTQKLPKQTAAIAFAYGDMMIERLQSQHNCDVLGSTSQLKGLDLGTMKAYAKARLCKIIRTQMFEGRIYGPDFTFSVPALHAWLQEFEQDYALISDFDPARGDAQTLGFTEDQKIDYAFWDAARTMQTWQFVA